MSTSQRLVPIRPSPIRGMSHDKMTGIQSYASARDSSTTMTPPKTGVKRKFEEDEDSEDYDAESCKRKINFAVDYVVSPQPVSISRRNARERNRVKQVNNGFAALRQHIPGASKAKKISKVDTLKQAVEYIQNLQKLLDENDRALIEETGQFMHDSNGPSNSCFQQNFTNTNSQDLQSPSYTHSPGLYNIPSYFFNENESPLSSAQNSPNIISSVSGSLPMQQSPSSTSSVYAPSIAGNSSPSSIVQSPAPPLLISPTSPRIEQTILPSISSTQSLLKMGDLNDLNQQVIYSNTNLTSMNLVRTHVVTDAIPNSESTIPQQNSYQSLQQENLPHQSQPLPNHLQQTISNIGHISHCDNISQNITSSATIESRVPVESTNFDHAPPKHVTSNSDFTHLCSVDTTPIKIKTEIPPYLKSTYANLPEESASTNIANIESVISSNLMSSFASLVDVYDTIDPTTSLVDGPENLLDAIDLWEKC